MATQTPIGTTKTVIRRTSSAVPKIAGKIPPWVIPARGEAVRNSQVSRSQPWMRMSPTITPSIATISSTATAVSPTKTPSTFGILILRTRQLPAQPADHHHAEPVQYERHRKQHRSDEEQHVVVRAAVHNFGQFS